MVTRRPDRHRHAAGWSAGVALLLLAAPALAAAPAPRDAELRARRFEYRVAWNGIPAAGATVAVTPGELLGQRSVAVEASARTNAFVDLFWSFRGTAKTTFLADGLEPLRFVFERSMAGTTAVTWIDFDGDDGSARSVYLKGAKRRELAVDEDFDILDPITAVFRARLSGAGAGDQLQYEIFTGESRYRVRLTVAGLDTIDVPAGRFRALRVVPEVWKLGRTTAPDRRLRHATIWVADDPERTLLRIRSEVFVGAVTLDLVKIDA